jgi:hypothetical protein
VCSQNACSFVSLFLETHAASNPIVTAMPYIGDDGRLAFLSLRICSIKNNSPPVAKNPRARWGGCA